MSSEDDFSSFLGDDVKPLKIEERAALKKSADNDVSVEQRRQAAQDEPQVNVDPLSSEPTEYVDPLAVLEFRRPGVQHGVYKNLRLGKYSLDARLDLHKMNVETARRVLYQFIKDCMQNDIRAALITHGKGEGRDTPAKLKSCVAHWLPQFTEVLAFHTAQKRHGSYGATYVLLRKSEKKREETRAKNTDTRPR